MGDQLTDAVELASRNHFRIPNESPEYRRARNALLAEEIELRRHIERVAEQRRALPAGGAVADGYRFHGAAGPVDFAGLFGVHETLLVYSYMFGPQREQPCPMCTSLLDAWNGNALDIQQRIALAVVARSPIERLLQFARGRGWRDLPLFSDVDGRYSRDYHAIGTEGGDDAALHVFTRSTEGIRHFYAAEMGFETADPGQDPRGAPDPMPLWGVLDLTPEGRGADWYPKLRYD
jgi:predicted dithiol-disulfide oxidoreductase (DUF899 family)